MSNETVRLKAEVKIMLLAKYQGERGPRPVPTGDDYRDQLEALQADLKDPACVELMVTGDSFPTQIWRK